LGWNGLSSVMLRTFLAVIFFTMLLLILWEIYMLHLSDRGNTIFNYNDFGLNGENYKY
jgi:hypothetical protein